MSRDDGADTRAVRAAIACIVAATVVSGPFVGAVDLSRPPDAGFLTCQGGSANAEVVDPPGDLSLERGEFGAGTYTFDGDPAVVEVDNVTGCPRLLYRIEVPALQFETRQVRFLEAGQAGELAIPPPDGSLAPATVDRETYEATVTVELEGDERKVLYRTNVTITVTG